MSSRLARSHVDPAYEVPANVWNARLRRSLRSKKGLRILKRLEAALLAMPEKRLARGQIATKDGDVCLIGAYEAYRRTQIYDYNRDWRSVVEIMLLEGADEEGSIQATAEYAAFVRGNWAIPWVLASELAIANDETVTDILLTEDYHKKINAERETQPDLLLTAEEYRARYGSRPEATPEQRYTDTLTLIRAWIKESEAHLGSVTQS
jgi:hypothetical protein